MIIKEENMSLNIIETINDLENLLFLSPATDVEIEAAEKELGMKFAAEYIDYVKTFGVIAAKGIELTGITTSERLSVVTATIREKNLNKNILDNMYVVENTAIDGIIILQDETGAIYSVTPGKYPEKLFDSLSEYIKNR